MKGLRTLRRNFHQLQSDREELQQEGELGSSLGYGVVTWGEVVAVKKLAVGGEEEEEENSSPLVALLGYSCIGLLY